MVLDNKTIEKIKSLVYQKPCTIQEIAQTLEKNWRTANRYVEQIMLRTGQIRVRTFREGTRGAIKIVYWNNTEKIYSTDVQEKLFKQIELGVEKSDFSPFEIYQYVDSENRTAYFEELKGEENYSYNMESLFPFFDKAEREIYIFAGNCAFVHFKYKNKTMLQKIKDAIKRGVIVNVITNINLIDLSNVEKLLSLNSGSSHALVQIRHEVTPLRAYIFDNMIARLGEIEKSTGKLGQIQNNVAVYYEIRDEAWVEWLKKMFFKKFQIGIPANKRLENIKGIRKIK
jgi:hypothetical protein